MSREERAATPGAAARGASGADGDLVLGLDVGTGSTKAGLVAADGTLVAVARAAHEVHSHAPDRSEADPSDWLASASAAAADVLSHADGAADRVHAIGLSGQMHGVVLCGEDAEPVGPAVLWTDRRATRVLGAFRRHLRDAGIAAANPVTPGMAGPALAWFASEQPEALDRARWALQPKDWLRLVLTGTAATEPSDASATLLWDPAHDDWIAEDVRDVLLDGRDLLAPVVPSGQVAGTLDDRGADLLGLSPGIPVAAGAADTAAALLGAGVAVGGAQVTTGTGGQVCVMLQRPDADPTGRTHLFRAARPGTWYAMAALQNVGVAVDWALAVLGADLDEAGRAVASSAPGASGTVFLPWLTGERTPWLDDTLTAAFRGLTTATTRNDLLRAVFEGVAFSLRDGLDALRAAGHDVDEALLAGGGSGAGWWQQLLADALGVPLFPHDVADASVLGAGLLGWASQDVTIDVAPRTTGPVKPTGTLLAARERWVQTSATVVDRVGVTPQPTKDEDNPRSVPEGVTG